MLTIGFHYNVQYIYSVCFYLSIGYPNKFWGIWSGDWLWHLDYWWWGWSWRPKDCASGVSSQCFMFVIVNHYLRSFTVNVSFNTHATLYHKQYRVLLEWYTRHWQHYFSLFPFYWQLIVSSYNILITISPPSTPSSYPLPRMYFLSASH